MLTVQILLKGHEECLTVRNVHYLSIQRKIHQEPARPPYSFLPYYELKFLRGT